MEVLVQRIFVFSDNVYINQSRIRFYWGWRLKINTYFLSSYQKTSVTQPLGLRTENQDQNVDCLLTRIRSSEWGQRSGQFTSFNLREVEGRLTPFNVLNFPCREGPNSVKGSRGDGGLLRVWEVTGLSQKFSTVDREVHLFERHEVDFPCRKSRSLNDTRDNTSCKHVRSEEVTVKDRGVREGGVRCEKGSNGLLQDK